MGELLAGSFPVSNIYGKQSWIDENQSTLESRKLEALVVNDKELSQISALNTANEVLAVCPIAEKNIPFPKKLNGLFLAADRIRDPGNLGTILRIADWYGCSGVLLSEGCADPYNPKTVQASMGSLFRVPFLETSLPEWLKANQEIHSIATVLSGENLYDVALPKDSILLIGNESQGLDEELIKLANQQLSLPRYGKAESLNAAIATAIFCAEFRRRD